MANVVVGVTGGIAAYKSALLIRLFTEAGHSVQVVATTNATRFIGTTTLEALSHNRVQIVDPDLFSDVDTVKHVALAKGADLIVVAPATASFLAKVAAGIADDLLTTTVIAASCPVLIAPAMHTEMWENSATVANMKTLTDRGFLFANPVVGRLTGDDSGAGRLADPEQIFEHAMSLLGSGELRDVRVLVTTGGTREKIDPARFIGNFSSGLQGLAFAEAARDLGATVKVIAANVCSHDLRGFDSVSVESAAELAKELSSHSGTYDLLVMAAAVADYRPTNYSEAKLKRSVVGESFGIELVANPDILSATTESLRSSGKKALVIGFAAETGSDLLSLATEKRKRKGCDFIIANDISNGEVFGSSKNSVILVSANGSQAFTGEKYQIAAEIMKSIASKIVETIKGETK